MYTAQYFGTKSHVTKVLLDNENIIIVIEVLVR